MNWQVIIEMGGVGLAAVLSGGVAWYAWRHRNVPGAGAFAVVAAAQALWSMFHICEDFSATLSGKLFWDNLIPAVGGGSGVAFLAFVLHYVGYRLKRPRLIYGLIYLPIGLVTAAHFIMPLNEWVRINPVLASAEPFGVLQYQFGPLSRWTIIYGYGLVLVALLVLVSRFWRASPHYYGQIAIIMAGQLIPLFFHIFRTIGLQWTPDPDLMPLAFTLSNLVIAYGLFHYNLFRVAPAVRSDILNDLESALLVFDEQSRLIDFNRATRRLFGDAPVIGRPAAEILASYPQLAAQFRAGTSYGKITIESHTYDVHFSQQEHNQIWVLMLHNVDERERMEEALRQSQALLLESEKMARLGSWEWDIAAGIITCSEGWQRIHGVERGRFPIEELFPIAHPDDRERVQAAWQDALSGKRPYDIEHRVIRQDTGEEQTVQAYGRVVWDEAGQPIRMYGTAQDITERKQAEAALHESLEKYRVLFNSFPLGITVSDAAGNIVEANRFSEKLLGISRTEHEQRAINGAQWRIIRPDGTPMPADEYASVRALQENRLVEQVEMGIVKPKEEITWISVTATPIPLAEYGVVIVYEDITGRKQAEQALKENEANIRYILKYNPNAIAVYDNNLNYIHVSDRYLEDYNVKEKDIIGKHHYELFPEIPDRWRRIHQRVLAGEVLRNDDDYFERPDGSITYNRWECRPWYHANGEIGGMITYTEVTTERKQMEAALRRRNRDLALLNRAGPAFNATLEPDQVFDLVLETMRDMWGALDSSIWLVEPFPPPANGEVALVCHYLSSSQNADIRGWRLALDQGVAGWVVQQQQSALVADTRLDPRHHKGVDEHTGQEVRSLLAAPLRSEAGVLGVLELVDHRPDRFEANDLQTLESLAATAAIAVRNARLYAQVQRDAETKALLLHEVNHRVKNNLDAIIGLLYLERRFAPPETRPYLQPIIADLSHRITGLAQVHRLLSASEWSPLLLSELVEQIIRTALQTSSADRQTTVEVPPSSIRVGPGQAHHLALVISELATNTLKYAVPEQEKTHIRVEISGQGDTVTLIYRNDGPGYPAEVLRLERHNAGLEIVQKIVRKNLGGQLTLRNEDGPVTMIQFQIEAEGGRR